MKDVIHISQAIESDFDEHSEDATELLSAIAARVAELLQEDPGLLFSYLYRLDVQENKVRAVMTNDQLNQVNALAQLIYERQAQRLHTKRTLKQKPIKGWEW